ncbi:uncharacterized protein Teh4 [Periplaneta americana]|uniref:uncharacterized protein Teh4 n=1 Tax=Periplaneta americana TaxID=6978 RepID=UPI0037E8CB13
MGQKYKPRIIPEQDRRICGSICFCQLTVVTSCVALVYLTVAIYIPSHKAFKSGIEPVPITCQTVRNDKPKNCQWASCGEWCLTKTSGFCPQIMVTARRNGTDIQVENCSRLQSFACPLVESGALKKFNCNNGSECGSLTGLFNCSLGHCANWSDAFQCEYKADGNTLDSEKDNMKMTGFFECNKSRCTAIKTQPRCDRFCSNIATANANVFVLYDDFVYSGDCGSVVALNSANGTDPGYAIEPFEIWNNTNKVLITSCQSAVKTGNGTTLKATDCLNGTLMDEEIIPTPSMNFTTLWELYAKTTELVDITKRFLPMQSELTIYNSTRLYINLDACVNTLKGECKEFEATHGRDGRNKSAQSRFPCYYDKNDGAFVVARFDLQKTWRELVIAVVLPTVMFLISSATLCIITRSVNVGDDAKMRCKYCGSGNGDDEEDMALSRGATRNNTNECLLPDSAT